MSRVLLLFLVVMMISVATTRADASDVTPKLFGSIPPQSARSGEDWQLHLRIPSRDGVPGRVSASHLPGGADMRIVNERWVVLEWRPAETQSGLYSLTLSAHFGGEDSATFYQVVDVKVSGHEKPIRMRPVRVAPRRKDDAVRMAEDDRAAEQESLEETIEKTVAMIDHARDDMTASRDDNAAPALIAPGEAASEAANARATILIAPSAALAIRAPSLERMATRIVSVGRTVSFELRPTVAGGRVAAVHVDRLPRNASFERNPDGSRTFFWPTGHRDQGEHVFRFTANHPDDPALLSVSEAVIIVGDPSQGGSAPRTSADPISAHVEPALDRDLAPELDEFPEDH